jgi:hypothetical protein
LCLVEAATTLQVVPDDLSPPLDKANRDDVIPGEEACVADIPDVEVPDCAFGDPGGSRSVVLYGDSFAAMWLPAFNAIGKRAHWKVTLLAKSGCTVANIDTFISSKQRAYTECNLWHDYAIKRINAAHPDLVVVSSSTGDAGADAAPIGHAEWQAALIKTLGLISVPDRRKIVLATGPVPFIGSPPDHFTGPDCLAAHLDNVQACSATRVVAIGWTFQPEERAAAAKVGAHYLDVDPWFCADDVCPAVIGKMNVYAHYGRLSATYATYLSSALQAELTPIMDAP